MAYLIYNDFKKSIQALNLQQVIGNDYSIIESWMLAAEEKATSYLTQKYNTEAEFTDTAQWVLATVYNAGDRVYLDADAYNAAIAYTIGMTVTYQSNYYTCTTAFGPATFDATKFSAPTPQYQLYYAKYPHPPFDINETYNTGDIVYYAGKNYTALQSSSNINNDYVLQYGSIQNIPAKNYFPGTANQGQWNSGVVYTVPTNTAITNTTYWTKGDNRSQEMLNVVIAIVLYYAHRRISPMNIPDLRKDDYREAKNWLQDACDGIVTPKLTRRMPNQGNKIRFGGSIRAQNSY